MPAGTTDSTRDDLVNGEEAAEVHLLARQVGHAAGGGFKTEHDVALELVFGSLQLCSGTVSSLRRRNSSMVSRGLQVFSAEVPA